MKVSFAILLSLVLADLGPTCRAAGVDRPNILFVFLDDFGWRDTGYMGSDFYETPCLDRQLPVPRQSGVKVWKDIAVGLNVDVKDPYWQPLSAMQTAPYVSRARIFSSARAKY